MVEESRRIRKRKSYAIPNLAESGLDKDSNFHENMSSSYYYAWFSSQWFR